MLHFEVEKTNLWFFWGGFEIFLKSQFFSDIPEFQVGGPINQQIKNMWPYISNYNMLCMLYMFVVHVLHVIHVLYNYYE
jgi:hypothetical protein